MKLTIDPIAAAVLLHDLRSNGMHLGHLGAAILLASKDWKFGESDPRSFTNDPFLSARDPNFPRMSLNDKNGRLINLPSMLWKMRRVGDDFEMVIREMEIAEGICLNIVDKATRIVTPDARPEVILSASQGRRLADVVSHPALDSMGLVITRAYNFPPNQTLNIGSDRLSMKSAFCVDMLEPVKIEILRGKYAMKYKITPFALGSDILGKDPMVSFARQEKHVVEAIGNYDERQLLEVEAESADEACEIVWAKYQNIDEGRLTPDRKRSLMVGDMARVVDAHGEESWWIVCSMGWAKTAKPGAERNEVGHE